MPAAFSILLRDCSLAMDGLSSPLRMHFDSITPSLRSWVESSFTQTTCLGTVHTPCAAPSSSVLLGLKGCMCTTRFRSPSHGRVPPLLRAQPGERSTLSDLSRTELLCDCSLTFPMGSYLSPIWIPQSTAVKLPTDSVTSERNSRRVSASGGLTALYVVDAVGAILQNAILARFLQLHDYGVLAAILSVGMFVFVVADFGTGLSVTRLMAVQSGQEQKDQFKGLWASRLVMTALSAGAAVAVGSFLAPGAALLVLVVIGSEMFRSVANFLTSAARGLSRVRAVMIISVFDRVGTLLGSVIAVIQGWGLGGVAGAYLLARAVSCSIALLWARSAGLSLAVKLPPAALWREWCRLTPLATLLFSDKIVFYSMPLLLAAFASAVQVGLFPAAFKIGLVPISLCSALLSAYFPEIVRDAHGSQGPKSIVGVYFFLSVVGTLLVALCFSVPVEVLRLVFGTVFVGGAATLRFIGLFVVLNTAYQVSVHLLPAYGRESILLRTTTIGACVCLVTAAITSSLLGALGAALAVVAYASVTLVPHVFVLRDVIRIDASQRNVISQGWLALSIGVLSALPLGLAHLRNPVLVGTWAMASVVGVYLLLAKNRSILLSLLWDRLGDSGEVNEGSGCRAVSSSGA